MVADPDFDLTPGKTSTDSEAGTRNVRLSRDFFRNKFHFKRLPGTRVEGERIADLLGVVP